MKNRLEANSFKRKKGLWIAAVAIPSLLGLFAAKAGDILIVDDPRPADVIVVLAGDTGYRAAQALRLHAQRVAPRVLIDVPAAARIYDFTQLELAKKYFARLPEAAAIEICPIDGLSTREESHDVEKCLPPGQGLRVLLVTSDFHTRRSLSIFRHELRGREFSVAAARDPSQFGARWWERRQWAKTCVDEWLRVLWWNCVERWN